MIIGFELVGILILFAVVWFLPDRINRNIFVRSMSRKFHQFAAHRNWSIVAVGVVSLSLHLPTLIWGDYPEPSVHDEFCYLLAAETFADGRLTNETHPLWEHFESFHLLQTPSYMSKYPPGQSLFLALGIRVGGHPVFGVWISMALASAAVCWMLQAWVPVRWALFGAMIMTLRLTPGYWGNSYWGGAVAAMGGALLLGALRRLISQQRWQDGMIFGLGLSILALSRSYEGFVFFLVATSVLMIALVSSNAFSLKQCLRLSGACIVIPMMALSWQVYFNYQVTGDPWKMPYQLHNDQYAANPTFFFQSDGEPIPEYRHDAFQKYYHSWERTNYQAFSVNFGWNRELITKLLNFLRFFVGPASLVPLLLCVRHYRDRWLIVCLGCCLAVGLAVTQIIYLFPHYAAPLTAPMTLFQVIGLDNLRVWNPGRKVVGRMMVWGIGCMFVLFQFMPAWQKGQDFSERSQLVTQLQNIPGQHVVFVHYAEDHNVHKEWVYNHADIDSSRIVWSRCMSPQQNQRVLDYYSDRQFWLLTFEEMDEAVLSPNTPSFYSQIEMASPLKSQTH
jgi:hypothetical protein